MAIATAAVGDIEGLESLMAINAVWKEYDVVAQVLERQLGVPLCVRCGRCCENNTPFAYGVEAAAAVSILLGQGRMGEVQRRIEGWLLDRQPECPTYEPLTLDRVTWGLDNKLRDEALALSRASCPLYEDRACLVHRARPLACRAHGVTTLVHSCSRPLGKGETDGRRACISKAISQELKLEVEATLNLVPKLTWKHAGFFPTLVYALVWPDKYRNMVASGQVATAKLVMTYPSLAVLWQDQVESLATKDMVVV